MKKIFFVFGFLLMGFFIFSPVTRAATIFLLPKNGAFHAGDTFNMEVRVNSEGQGFNAAQATIQFPKDIFQVKSLDYSSAASVFNFWLVEPKFSNDQGNVAFIGGTTSGVVGASVEILKINFSVKSVGEGDVTISDAAITASDGSGTNILSTVDTAKFTVSPGVVTSETPIALPVPLPVQIIRAPVASAKLPAKPEISVPLYPDPAKWYNSISNFLVQWNLPDDISGVSTVLNNNSKFTPAAQSEGLFDSKTFAAISDGISYLHIRFKNNVGWGPSSDYRLAIDTVPPLPFNIDVNEGLSTDNPSPTIHFPTSDGLSGLKNYSVRIGDGDAIVLDKSDFTLSVQAPGSHSITARAIDNANNITESNINMEITPIASPAITFVNQSVFSGEGGFTTAGTALPNSSAIIFVKSTKGALTAQLEVKVDKDGNWQAVFNDPFKNGSYVVEAVARDARGALSLPVQSEVFKIREKPLFTLGGVEITQFWFFVGLIIVLLGGFAGGWFSYELWKRQVGRKTVIAERDVMNMFRAINGDIDKMLANYGDRVINQSEAIQMEFLLKGIKANLEKAQKYIIENIKEISD